eukprot:COSAG02_NODE_31298_length_536_cov_0.649886_1_plen_45_part_10
MRPGRQSSRGSPIQHTSSYVSCSSPSSTASWEGRALAASVAAVVA